MSKNHWQFVAPLLIIGTLVPTLAFSQNFWKSLDGPPAVASSNTVFTPDSVALAMRVAGVTYVAKGAEWMPTSARTLFDIPVPSNTWITEWYSGNSLDTCFAYYGTTLYGSTDFGAHWDTALAARRLQSYGVRRTPSAIIVPIAGTGFCVTHDFFQSVDTLQVPSGGSSYYLQNSGDLLGDAAGNQVYSSTDFGRTWKSVYAAAPGFYLRLAVAHGVWVVTGWRQSDSTNVFAYSTDNSITWRTGRTPHDSLLNLDAIGTDQTIYGHTYEGNDVLYFRTTDFGVTWNAIDHPVQLVSADGSLYSEVQYQPSVWVVSRDRGDSWDTIRSSNLASVPFSMTAARDTTWMSTFDSLYFSIDNGQNWQRFSEAGRGYLYPSDEGAVWFNTSRHATPTKLMQMCQDTLRPPIPSGPGLVTPSGKVWVSDLGGTGMLNNPGRLYESFDGGCSFWTWTLPIIPARFIDMLPLRGDTVLFISKYMIMRDDDLRFILDTVTPERGPETNAIPTGAAVVDSAGMIVVAMTDGKLFASTDGAHGWWYFTSPSINGESYVTHLAADPSGHLFAIDSNLETGITKAFEFDSRSGWTDITTGLERPTFPGPAHLTSIWYENNYVYAGAWDMGLFRSIDPVRTESVHHSAAQVDLEVSPTPASHLLTVELPDQAGGKLTFSDVTGRVRDTFDVAAGRSSIVIPLERFESGSYFVMYLGKTGPSSAKIAVLR